MDEQFDIIDFAKMFDAALASDNPAVKKVLRNFMMVAAIVHAEDQTGEERLMGPLETLVKKVADLEVIVHSLRNTTSIDRDYQRNYYSNYPTWAYNPNTSVTSTSGTTTWNESTDDIFKYLKDIKIT